MEERGALALYMGSMVINGVLNQQEGLFNFVKHNSFSGDNI
jgi:hypothetical protein